MRMPRVRFTLRRMMVVVAALALASWGFKRYLHHREVTWGGTRGNPNLLSKCTLSALLARSSMGPDGMIEEGTEVPVDVAYDFALTSPVPPPGLEYLMWVDLCFRDVATGEPAEGYTFDVPLTTGAREHASGKFTWSPKVPRPGTYMLAHYLRYRNPLGEWRMEMGGESRVEVLPRPATLTPPPRP
jgi:hypothetical protein